MLDPKTMLNWATGVEDACVALQKAVERVLAVGGGQAGSEITAALAVCQRVAQPLAGMPQQHIAAAQRLSHAARGLGQIAGPGAGDEQVRMTQFLEITSAVQAAVARAQNVRLVALTAGTPTAGPVQPSLLAWAAHWDALGFYHEAIGRQAAGLDTGGPDAALLAGLKTAVDTLQKRLSEAEAGLDAIRPNFAATLDVAQTSGLASFGETIALDKKTLAEWRGLLRDPSTMTAPAKRAVLVAFDQFERQRVALHDVRINIARQEKRH
jgi:hypothetical protein